MHKFPLLLTFLLTFLYVENASAISLEVEPTAPTPVGNETDFSVSISDETGVVELRWDFGDGTELAFATGQESAGHTYAAPGHYAVIVVARDDAGFSSASFVHTVHRELTKNRPSAASSIVYDEERAMIASVNPDNDSVTLIDAKSLEKLVEIPVYDQPVSLAFMPDGRLWVVHRQDYAIAMIDVGSREITGNLRLPYASQPIALAISPAGDAAYVTLMATGQLVKLDPTSGDLLDSLDVGPWPRGLAISANGEDIYVTRFISKNERGEVTHVRASDFEVERVIELSEDTTTEDTDQKGRGLPNYLLSVTISPDGLEAWIPAKKDNMSRGLLRDGQALTQDNTLRPMLGILDLSSGEEALELRIDLDDRNLPSHVTFSPLGDYAFVSVLGSSVIEVRDVFDQSFVTALGDPGFSPLASVLTEDGKLFVHAELSRQVSVYDVSEIISGQDQLTQKLANIPVVENEALLPAVLLGKQIFHNSEDKRMTQEGYISCASCHFEGFEDGRVWEFTDRGEGLRNTTSLLGRSGMGHGRVHWTGNFDEIQDFEGAIRGNFGGTGFLSDELYEEGTYADPLGDPKAGHSPELDALALYVTSLDSVPPSPFKQSDGTFTEAAQRGKQLFLELQCDSCHAGSAFTNSAEGVLYDVGTLKETSGFRLGDDLVGIDTPTLLGIWQTAPYLHDGSAETLLDVLTTQNPNDLHGETSGLSEVELQDLVSYLHQIDANVPPKDLPPLARDEPNGPTSSGKAAGGGGCSLAGAPSLAQRLSVSNLSNPASLFFGCIVGLTLRRRARKRARAAGR